MSVTHDEAEAIAQRAIEGFVLRLGVDKNDPHALQRLKDNLDFLDRLNSGAKLVKNTTIKTVVGAVVAGLIALVLIGFRDWIIENVLRISR